MITNRVPLVVGIIAFLTILTACGGGGGGSEGSEKSPSSSENHSPIASVSAEAGGPPLGQDETSPSDDVTRSRDGGLRSALRELPLPRTARVDPRAHDDERIVTYKTDRRNGELAQLADALMVHFDPDLGHDTNQATVSIVLEFLEAEGLSRAEAHRVVTQAVLAGRITYPTYAPGVVIERLEDWDTYYRPLFARRADTYIANAGDPLTDTDRKSPLWPFRVSVRMPLDSDAIEFHRETLQR